MGGSSMLNWSLSCVSHLSSGRHSSVDAPGGDRLASDTGMSIDVTIACSW